MQLPFWQCRYSICQTVYASTSVTLENREANVEKTAGTLVFGVVLKSRKIYTKWRDCQWPFQWEREVAIQAVIKHTLKPIRKSNKFGPGDPVTRTSGIVGTLSRHWENYRLLHPHSSTSAYHVYHKNQTRSDHWHIYIKPRNGSTE